MNILFVIGAIVVVCGGIGGFINALMAGDLRLPHRDEASNLYSPGWAGNVAVGAIAALVYWALYGPLAKMSLFGVSPAVQPTFTLAELAGSIVTGIGGGRILSNEVDKKALEKSRDLLANQVGKEKTNEQRDPNQ